MDIVEGWTEPLEFSLLIGKPGAAFDATGMIPHAEAHDKDGLAVVLAGATTWADPAKSQARYVPQAGEFLVAKSPYGFRIRVQDTGGTLAWWPNAKPLPLIVRP